jgi:hypothetical protein|tara:strand:- start:15266 stop:15670 length:405 start_codon:yes stop_codon:yes gene_type:complete
MNWIDLLGTPFKLHGTGPDGLDCSTVAEEVLRRLGHEPPPTSPFRRRPTARSIDAYFGAMDDSYSLVGRATGDARALGDVVLANDEKGRPSKLFVLVEEGGTFLTADHISGVRSCARRQIENVVGVYRLKGLST